MRDLTTSASLQDRMLTRVETARKEMQHIGDFDYGELGILIVCCRQPKLPFTAVDLSLGIFLLAAILACRLSCVALR